MLPWKLRKRQILPVNQNLSPAYFSPAKFQLVSCNLSLAMIWQMTYTHKLPKLCSATLRHQNLMLYLIVPHLFNILWQIVDTQPKAILVSVKIEAFIVLGVLTKILYGKASPWVPTPYRRLTLVSYHKNLDFPLATIGSCSVITTVFLSI